MTVLSACQEAAIELSQTEPTTLFSTTDRFAKELRVQANKSAVAIMKRYDWQILTKRATITGDGSDMSFDLPSDYDRMAAKTNLASSASNIDLVKAKDLDQWDYFLNHMSTTVPGYWIVLGGQLQVRPAPAIGVVHSYYYISKNAVSGDKPAFTADTDTFVLPERLLTLSIIWRWRASKRLEYAEDMQNFEIAFGEESATDKGSRVLVAGRQRVPYNVKNSYPGPLGP
ncbi:hypothetical protein [Bradyrhizobium sp.]|jgi:hypothetical protein|uniref:phage adaptor protein n=1 Tax=Bradyrhizobium sp. TaxID=376 RepID=UPI002DDD0926|nr:hypothetical protein [Bradyrhizobium sp.]HEV2160242.1 hypothetical protein [Bradyrhizobium sp.]